MARVYGHLRPDRATHGEKLVLRKLRTALPQDFDIYVECPLQHGRIQRFPDFIVLCNFGVVVLEVKDWVEVLRADKYGVDIRRRDRVRSHRKNPVGVARGCAIVLKEELQNIPELINERRRLDVPWGYAVVLPNLPASVITQLRRAWGELYVLGTGDLEPHVITKRLKATLPYHRDLRRGELRLIRAVVNPTVLIVPEDTKRAAIILDDAQETIVVEEPRTPVVEQLPEPAPAIQQEMALPTPKPEVIVEEAVGEEPPLRPLDESIVLSASVRLVRGVAGSGKTLILTRRASYLAAQYPEWRICVLTYNEALARSLRALLKGIPGIKRVTTFHSVCAGLLKSYIEWKTPSNPEGWLKACAGQWPIIEGLGADFVGGEITWIKEMGVSDRTAYLQCERKGRGRGLRTARREQIYDVLEAYQAWQAKQKAFDWADVPHLLLQGMNEGRIKTGMYDAILIDEAQDFAPIWIEVVTRLLKPEEGLLFLADDPSQSIYRYYSWQEKGISVVGRTRWLRVPYRNTREIYQAAYEVIRDDAVLKHQLEEQGGMNLEEPDLAGKHLRSGPRPELRRFSSSDAEFDFIRLEIERLLQGKFDAEQIAVLHRRKRGAQRLGQRLRGLGVRVATLHKLKGLEFDVVFLSQMQETFADAGKLSEEQISGERRLVYMAMTRARQRLYLNYEGHWPRPIRGVTEYVDRALA